MQDQPGQGSIEQRLTAIFRDTFLRDDLTLSPAMTAADIPGWDSTSQIEIILAVEDTWGIKLTTSDLDTLHSVGDLVRVVRRATLRSG